MLHGGKTGINKALSAAAHPELKVRRGEAQLSCPTSNCGICRFSAADGRVGDGRHLIEEPTVSYAPSLAVLREGESAQAKAPQSISHSSSYHKASPA